MWCLSIDVRGWYIIFLPVIKLFFIWGKIIVFMEKRILWMFLALFLFSCTSDDEFINSKVDQYVKSQTRVALFDTLSVKLSTMIIDSIETSGTENLLVGKYSDSELGTVTSSSYFELDIPEDITLEDNEIYDSLTLVLKYSDLTYGDTLQPQTFKVYRVLEEIEPDEQESVYNTSSFKYDDTPIGELTFVPNSYKSDSIVIRLDDSLGLEFFSKMLDEDDDMTLDTDFKEYFKGLVIVPDNQNTAVLSFEPDSVTYLSVQSHLPDLTRTEKQYKFSFSTAGNYFNHIDCDRTGTPLELLKTQRVELPSTETDNKAFIQSGAGIALRVNFPNLQRLIELGSGNIMYKAELVLRVYPGSDKMISPPDQLVMYYTDKYNNLISLLNNSDSETIYSSYYSDDMYDTYNYYTLDLTTFLSNELSDGYVDEDLGMIISLPESEFKGSLNRLVVDARSGSEYRPVLNIYYVFFE